MPVLNYDDKSYDNNQQLYACLEQAFQDFKYGTVHSNSSWNTPVHDIEGLTLRYLGENRIQVTRHHYVVGTVESVKREMEDGRTSNKFLNDVMREMKRIFKKNTGKALKVEKVGEMDRKLDKTHRVSAEQSFLLSANKYGYGQRPVGKYLFKDSCVYDVDAKL